MVSISIYSWLYLLQIGLHMLPDAYFDLQLYRQIGFWSRLYIIITPTVVLIQYSLRKQSYTSLQSHQIARSELTHDGRARLSQQRSGRCWGDAGYRPHAALAGGDSLAPTPPLPSITSLGRYFIRPLCANHLRPLRLKHNGCSII